MLSRVIGKIKDHSNDKNKLNPLPPKVKIKPLPQNFQENVILKEMKFDNGQRDLQIIKELLFLYSVCFYNIAWNGVL